jgi:hypothetical protein
MFNAPGVSTWTCDELTDVIVNLSPSNCLASSPVAYDDSGSKVRLESTPGGRKRHIASQWFETNRSGSVGNYAERDCGPNVPGSIRY